MPINWKNVPNFERWEFDDPNFPGSGDLISPILLERLVELRLNTKMTYPPDGWPVVIHGYVGGAVDVKGVHGHAAKSYHLKLKGCKAADFHFQTDANPREQYWMVSKVGFGGLGVYEECWNDKQGILLPIAFHVDTRPKKKAQRWKFVDGEYVYLMA